MKNHALQIVAIGPSLLLLLFGCGSPLQRNYFPSEVLINEPAVGQTATVRVGDEMLRQGRRFESDAINVPRTISAEMFGVSHAFAPGFYLKYAEEQDGDYYVPERGWEGGAMSHSSVTTPVQSLFVAKSGDKVCGVNLHRDKFCTEDFEIERTKRNSYARDAFQQTLLYSGRVDNRIRISYREFLNDLARPAFSNDVEYDLDQSRTVAYKGAQLEIIEATNQAITYRVISNFRNLE